jgi:hypothetical protein
VVVLGGHIDSWDVGQGAQDDGSGIMGTFEAVSLIHKLGLKPKRTIRIVFWVNEENGGAGGRAYREMIGNKIGDQVAAIEMDGGAAMPINYGSWWAAACAGSRLPGAVPAPAARGASMRTLSPRRKRSFCTCRTLLVAVRLARIRFRREGSSDIGPIVADSVPSLSPRTVGEHCSDWHHTEADTLEDKSMRIRSEECGDVVKIVIHSGRYGWAGGRCHSREVVFG